MGFTRKPNKLFTEEVFGAEYEEGISGMKNWKMGFLPRIRYAMKPDEAYGLVLSWDNVVISKVVDLNCVDYAYTSSGPRLVTNSFFLLLQEIFLSILLDRRPSKCVVFEDDPRDITATHNCTIMAVGLIGVN
ncbi:unnamed protein product [Brassica rapa subsp. trilocularis]